MKFINYSKKLIHNLMLDENLILFNITIEYVNQFFLKRKVNILKILHFY